MHHPFHHPTLGLVSRTLTTLVSTVVLASSLFFWFFGTYHRPVINAQASNQADVIVQFDDHAHVVRTITFTQPISGLATLNGAAYRSSPLQPVLGQPSVALQGLAVRLKIVSVIPIGSGLTPTGMIAPGRVMPWAPTLP